MQETPVQFLGQEDPLEKGKATHSSILAWRIPWMESQRPGHDRATFPFHEVSVLVFCPFYFVFVCYYFISVLGIFFMLLFSLYFFIEV